MLTIKNISVGDRFRVIKDDSIPFSEALILNGMHISNDDKPKQTVMAGFEFEVTRKYKKVANAENYSFEIKPLDQKLHYEIFARDLTARCERLGPPCADTPIKYVLHELAPQIFCAKFEDAYDLAMTFLRAQEYYESASADFRGKSFSIHDYMRWYAKNQGRGVFTYPKDWGGFNVSSDTINQILKPGFIKDWNYYDDELKAIFLEAKAASTNKSQFYIIGTMKDDARTLRHEIAHGLYFTNLEYRAKMDWATSMNSTQSQAMFAILRSMGYAEVVLRDEAQAYLATGLTSQMENDKAVNNEEVRRVTAFNYAEYSNSIMSEI